MINSTNITRSPHKSPAHLSIPVCGSDGGEWDSRRLRLHNAHIVVGLLPIGSQEVVHDADVDDDGGTPSGTSVI